MPRDGEVRGRQNARIPEAQGGARKKLADWARWFFKENKWDCASCKRAQRDGFRKERCEGIDYVDECPTKEVPRLGEKNEGCVRLFLKLGHGLWNGMGGINVEAVRHMWDIYGVPEGERPVLWDMWMNMVGIIKQESKGK